MRATRAALASVILVLPAFGWAQEPRPLPTDRLREVVRHLSPGPLAFERGPGGARLESGAILRSEFRGLGILFPEGVEVIRCGSPSCARARSGTNVARAFLATEFTRKPLVIRFIPPRAGVVLHVAPDGPLPSGGVDATLIAYSETGGVLSRASRHLVSPTWQELAVRSSGAPIARVELTGGARVGARPSHALLVDDVATEAADSVRVAGDTDERPPRIAILSPESGTASEEDRVPVEIQVFDDRRLALVDLRVTDERGAVTTPYGSGNVCGTTIACPPTYLRQTVQVELSRRPGRHTLTFRACDDVGNCADSSMGLERRLPTVSSADLWVLGIEYNQGVQDVVYTDLTRGSEVGFVPLRYPNGKDTELARPIIPGKSMVVRVYVGLRDGLSAAGPVQATGTLLVQVGPSTELPRTLRPLETGACENHLGAVQPCRRIIDVYPSLGRLGFTTHTDHDLDLIAARSHWGGTLNFVLPPDMTARINSVDGLELRAIVEPVGAREAAPADNEFRLQLRNVAPAETLEVRLVRVRMPRGGPPTREAADRALEEAVALLPYTGLRVVSDLVYDYAGERSVVLAEFLGVEIMEERLDQCESLWLKLFTEFGLDPGRTLVALTPSEVELDGCAGLGWRVPELEALRTARSRELRFLGGIAHSRAPAYSGDSPLDRSRVATLAMELAHADRDDRHVSNDHGEVNGCYLTDADGGALVAFAVDLAGFGIDVSCWKPSPHPHGMIGTYPAAGFAVGVPGNPTLHTPGNPIWGNLGSMGVRMEPLARAGYRLTLYDPCPTGPVDRANPRATLARRIGARGWACSLEHGQLPHSFLSYGPNGWIATETAPVIKNARGSY